MMKNIQWDTGTKIKVSIIVFIFTFVRILTNAASNSLYMADMVLIQAVAALAFTAYFMLTFNQKGFSLFSGQGFFGAVCICFVLFGVLSASFISDNIVNFVLLASVLLVCSQNIVIVPVAAVISVIAAVKYQDLGMLCIPAAAGASLIFCSADVKASVMWKKILFAVSVAVMLASASYAFYFNRYKLSVQSLITEVWDSAASVVAIALLIALAVISIKKKRPLSEIFGYIAAAAFSVVPLFMYKTYVISSAAALYMMFPVICRNGLPTEEITDKMQKALCSKFRK